MDVITANKFFFHHPTRCLVVGPSACGKTEFMKKVIDYRQELFDVVPKRIYYTYKYPLPWFRNYPEVTFVKEVPTHLDAQEPSMIVIDDVICENEILKQCASLFVRGSHHMNASIFFITQNLFVQNADYRTMSLNTNQFVLFKNPLGLQQITYLGRKLYANKRKLADFLQVYNHATQQPHSYLLVDLEPTQEHRLRTHIFPNETELVYLLEEA